MAANSGEQPTNFDAQAPGRGRPFRPGQSGNPAGRPKRLLAIEAEIRDLHGPKTLDVLDRLHGLALAGNVAAAKVYLDRVLGPARTPDPIRIAEHLCQVERYRIDVVFKALGERLYTWTPAEVSAFFRESAGKPREFMEAAEEYLDDKPIEQVPPHVEPALSGTETG